MNPQDSKLSEFRQLREQVESPRLSVPQFRPHVEPALPALPWPPEQFVSFHRIVVINPKFQ